MAGLLYDGGGELKLQDGICEKLTARVDLRAFYKELHAHLVDKGFKDTWDPGNHANAGEFVDNKANLNRTGDMFETEFMTLSNGKQKEIEVKWSAVKKVPDSTYGTIIFKFDLSCRNMKDVEFLEHGQKKVMQEGGWEFRNGFIYKNNVVDEYLSKIPFIKDSPTLKKFFFEFFYGDSVERDISVVMSKVKPGIYGIIDKHFGRS